MHPHNLSWVELKEYIEEIRGPIILPIGSVEGHGAHLPINTDTLIASFIADKLAERNGWVSLPPITYTIAIPIRPRNVHVKPRTFGDYLQSIIEHFIKFGQEKFVLIIGHGGPQMKKAIIEACNNLYESHNASIIAFRVARILEELNLVDTSKDKHAGTWETSCIMVINSSLVRDLEVYRRLEPRKYGVIGNPLEASPELGLEFIEAVISHIENFIKSFRFSECYYKL
ncbi:MAG: hypothetical protein DRO15_01215 [Thermoprotei archaeon]|nr:MAG: hypothetical protein DRO15_01215 [Thermoprotei archaeon]